jgi:predicted  nucleic acid-binding Zn-ribbon protein
MELRKVSQEKEKAQTENDKLMYDLERVATQNNKSQAALEKSQEEVARLQVSF